MPLIHIKNNEGKLFFKGSKLQRITQMKNQQWYTQSNYECILKECIRPPNCYFSKQRIQKLNIFLEFVTANTLTTLQNSPNKIVKQKRNNSVINVAKIVIRFRIDEDVLLM